MSQTSLFLMQAQVLTPNAIESITQSGTGLLIQLPILVAAVIGLIIAFVRLKNNRLISIMTIIASVLLFVGALSAPLVRVWIPFFFTPAPQTLPDGTTVEPSLAILQNNLFYASLTNSIIISLALLIYLAAIFLGRAKKAAAPTVEKI
jgi:hypothetical protein